jgi:hypothetical protein
VRTVLAVLTTWFAVSAPVGLLVGRLLDWIVGRDEEREWAVWEACLYPGRESYAKDKV